MEDYILLRRVISNGCFGSLPASEYTTRRVTAFGQKRSLTLVDVGLAPKQLFWGGGIALLLSNDEHQKLHRISSINCIGHGHQFVLGPGRHATIRPEYTGCF